MTAIRIERQGDLAVLRMDRPRGNAIDASFVAELHAATNDVAADPAVRGVLLASAHPKLFCPGLDLVSLYEYDRPRMDRFFAGFAEMLFALYGLEKPVVAAIEGAAVAGGCVLALTADERVLKRGGVEIGLAEVRVGVPLPWSVSLLLQASVAPPALAHVALLGRNFADEAAVTAGLVHLLADGDGFEATCLGRLRDYAEKDPMAFGPTKRYLRARTLAAMKAEEEARRVDFLDCWFSEPGRRRIGGIVEKLKGR